MCLNKEQSVAVGSVRTLTLQPLTNMLFFLSGCVCFVLQLVLTRNISVLQENIEQLRQTEANLTAQLGLKEGRKKSITAMKGDFLRESPLVFLAALPPVTMTTCESE